MDVDNVQEGEDDCRQHYVSREKLEELLSVVKTVLKASQLVDGTVVNCSRTGGQSRMGPFRSSFSVQERFEACTPCPVT